MPQPDHEIIKAVLTAVLSDRKDPEGRTETERLEPRPGTLIPKPTEPRTLTSAAAALAEFSQLDGPGWLQEAGTRAILHGEAATFSTQLAKLDLTSAWPVAGERASADGTRSLHLRRTAEGWVITHFEEAASADGLLLTQRLISTDLQHYLVYHVAYRPERIGTHDELRPFASRFVGFELVKADGGQPAHHGQPPTT